MKAHTCWLSSCQEATSSTSTAAQSLQVHQGLGGRTVVWGTGLPTTHAPTGHTSPDAPWTAAKDQAPGPPAHLHLRPADRLLVQVTAGCSGCCVSWAG